jgi:DNA-directed RNA polymerase subunit beta
VKLRNSETVRTNNKKYSNLAEINHLNDDGIITVGTFVKPGDILVGKVISNNTSDNYLSQKVLRLFFGAKSQRVKR